MERDGMEITVRESTATMRSCAVIVGRKKNAGGVFTPLRGITGSRGVIFATLRRMWIFAAYNQFHQEGKMVDGKMFDGLFAFAIIGMVAFCLAVVAGLYIAVRWLYSIIF